MTLKGRDLINKNASGYFDPTASAAIHKVSKEEEIEVSSEDETRFHDLLNTIFYICRLAGFRVEGRVVLKDTKTGKIWR